MDLAEHGSCEACPTMGCHTLPPQLCHQRQRQPRQPQAPPTGEDARGQGAPSGEASAVAVIQRGILMLCRGGQDKQPRTGISGLAGGLWNSRAVQQSRAVQGSWHCRGQADCSAMRSGSGAAQPPCEMSLLLCTASQCLLQHWLAAPPRPAPGGTDCTLAAPWLQPGGWPTGNRRTQ